MLKWFEYLKVGAMLVVAMADIAAGRTALFSFTWKGHKYELTLSQENA